MCACACACLQWVPGAGAAPAHSPGPGDREADGAAEGVAVEGAAEVPTAAPHAGEGQAADAPARGKDAPPPAGTCGQTPCASTLQLFSRPKDAWSVEVSGVSVVDELYECLLFKVQEKQNK